MVIERSLADRFRRLYIAHSSQTDKNYKARQAAFIKWADKKHLKGNSRTLVDIGGGNGVLRSMLKQTYRAKGIDVSNKEVVSAKQRVKGVKFIVADMLNFDLKEKFSIITCFDAIDHGDDLRKGIKKTLSNFYRHLEANGMLIFSLSMAKDCWINGGANTTILSVKGEKWISIIHRCIRNNKLNFDRVTLLLKNSKTFQEFKTSVLEYRYGLLETEKVRNITNNLGFNTFVYVDWSRKTWNKDSSEAPIFVCVKKR